MLKIGHEVVRPGKNVGDSSVTIPVPEELETVPGIPKIQREVDWYAREYPVETMNITERASRDWANAIRDQHVEMREIRKEHDKLNRSLIMGARLTGDLEPSAEPTGEDVGEAIKAKARELGYVEVGFTAYDSHYTYQSKKDWVKFPTSSAWLTSRTSNPPRPSPALTPRSCTPAPIGRKAPPDWNWVTSSAASAIAPRFTAPMTTPALTFPCLSPPVLASWALAATC